MKIYKVMSIDKIPNEREDHYCKTFTSLTIAKKYMDMIVENFIEAEGSRIDRGNKETGQSWFIWEVPEEDNYFHVWIEAEDSDTMLESQVPSLENIIEDIMEQEKKMGTDKGVDASKSAPSASWPHKPSKGEMLNVLQYLDKELMVRGSFQEVCDYVRKLADKEV